MASATIAITITSPPSVTLAFSPASFNGQLPIAAGTLISTVTVTPPEWDGALALTQTGPQAGAFVLNGNNLVVGTAPITAAGAYSTTVTATP